MSYCGDVSAGTSDRIVDVGVAAEGPSYSEPTIAPGMASYKFLAILSITLNSSRVQIHIRVATLLTSVHSAIEEPGFT